MGFKLSRLLGLLKPRDWPRTARLPCMIAKTGMAKRLTSRLARAAQERQIAVGLEMLIESFDDHGVRLGRQWSVLISVSTESHIKSNQISPLDEELNTTLIVLAVWRLRC